MDFITKVLYWISTGLMIPVIILLLGTFIRALILVGGFYGLYVQKIKFNKKFNSALKGLNSSTVGKNISALGNNNKILLSHTLHEILNTERTSTFINKVLNDYEMACKKDLSSSQTLAKLGPILGLMGTLIPMGPSLVGLAAGDIASMASNMQVAFSTTVIGLFTGAIGFTVQQIKKRWYTNDILNLEFVAELLVQSEKTKDNQTV